MSQTASDQPSEPRRNSLRTLALLGLVLVAILSVAFAGYTALTPHAAIVTEQQFLTNTQSVHNTQTVITFSTMAGFSTVTATTTTGGSGTYTQNCPYYGCSYQQPPYYTYPGYDINGNFNPPCKSTSSNMIQCRGYLDQNRNGCLVLVIPISNPYILESFVFQYYTLHNSPSSIPPMGTLVTVTGQLYQGYNTSSSGAACPGNYINVTSISQ